MMPPMQTLLDEYQEAVKSDDAMAESQLPFALAVRLEAGRSAEGQARQFAAASLAAAERAPSATLDDVSSPRVFVGGISMPDYFHAGVARARLAHLLTPIRSGDRHGS
jgi:hypothetical protein